MSEKTVFISYRRDDPGSSFARSLELALTQRGYDVFLDVDRLAGPWPQQLAAEIAARSHFLLVLTPGALDRCVDEEDWVRREYEMAVQHGRNVVPVLTGSAGVEVIKTSCPPAMLGLFDFSVAPVRHGSFVQDIGVLVDRHIPPHRAPKAADDGAGAVGQRTASTRLTHVAETLFGRDDELARLDAAWADAGTNVVTLVAWGGVGKTSLVAKWAAGLAKREYDGADYFDWSFYSQGTGDHLRASGATGEGSASADVFVAKALTFFGDPATAESAASPWDKGSWLAQILAERRALLVLDGLEPLQYPPGPLAGELKDPVVTALLKGLAARNAGLCVVTTRESVTDLASFRDSTAPERQLGRLSKAAGVALLEKLGVHGAAKELEKLVADVKGHALTLNLLGSYLARAVGGDVRRRDRVKLEKASARIQGDHAFKTMAAYRTWLAEGGEEGARQLAVLRLMGLFDRPADAGCLAALRREPTIKGLTEPLFRKRKGWRGWFTRGVPIGDEDWNLTVAALADCGLVSSEGTSLDAHPLIREYYARELRDRDPDAWRAAHGRLFDYLQETTEHQPDDLAGLQPLYQAVAHGCQAGRHEEARAEVYRDRILRGTGTDGHYSWKKLGAFGADLGAVACFFEPPWRRASPSLPEGCQTWLLGQAALYLRALGRLTEAAEPMQAALEMGVEQEDWKNNAISASNLSELELTLGDVASAVRDAEQSVHFADRSGDAHWPMGTRTTLADALHQAGRRDDALARFLEAEEMQAERQPEYPLLYSVQGFKYCDLLLVGAERAAWRAGNASGPAADGEQSRQDAGAPSALAEACQEVEERAAQTLEWATQHLAPLDVALDHLTLGRAGLYQAILERLGLGRPGRGRPSPPADPPAAALERPRSEIENAVDGLRRAGTIHHIPRGLLTRAWLRALSGDAAGARADLDEAGEIAARGPMPLHQADVHLHRARLFRDRDALAEARRLIENHGYGRRLDELADAEAWAEGWSG
ncbi:MAG: TIR domain-containing protein [bacterium]|nr:TIR domain-containing protein [bacterium]